MVKGSVIMLNTIFIGGVLILFIIFSALMMMAREDDIDG
jgi:hypothetical protein